MTENQRLLEFCSTSFFSLLSSISLTELWVASVAYKKASRVHRIPSEAVILAPLANPHAWQSPALLRVKSDWLWNWVRSESASGEKERIGETKIRFCSTNPIRWKCSWLSYIPMMIKLSRNGSKWLHCSGLESRSWVNVSYQYMKKRNNSYIMATLQKSGCRKFSIK